MDTILYTNPAQAAKQDGLWLDTEIGIENLCVDEYYLANARWYITVDNSGFAEGSHL